MASIDESSESNAYDDKFISTNALIGIWDGSQIHPEINARNDILKTHDHIRQTQNDCKEA